MKLVGVLIRKQYNRIKFFIFFGKKKKIFQKNTVKVNIWNQIYDGAAQEKAKLVVASQKSLITWKVTYLSKVENIIRFQIVQIIRSANFITLRLKMSQKVLKC